MKFIKEFFKQIKDMFDGLLNKLSSNPLVKKLIMAVFIFILIFFIIVLTVSCSNRKYSYENFEKKMVSMAKNKYHNSDKLPAEDKGVLEIPLQSFIDDGTIKDTQSIIQNKSVCTGNVKIINNNGYYLYIPFLDCGKDYKTTTIYETITDDNNIVRSGNGLYHINNEYIFKGDKVNNYLSLNNATYRILKINADGSLRIINTGRSEMIPWDDRYNIDRDSNYGINNYVHNSINSRIKDYIEDLYDSVPEEEKAYYATTDICIGKRSIDDNIFNTSIECSQTAKPFPYTLLNANEYYAATLDENCQSVYDDSCANYNYLGEIGTTWTITADKDTSYRVYRLSSSGLYLTNASNNSYFKIVTTINGDLLYSKGDGSQNNPYEIKKY